MKNLLKAGIMAISLISILVVPSMAFADIAPDSGEAVLADRADDGDGGETGALDVVPTEAPSPELVAPASDEIPVVGEAVGTPCVEDPSPADTADPDSTSGSLPDDEGTTVAEGEDPDIVESADAAAVQEIDGVESGDGEDAQPADAVGEDASDMASANGTCAAAAEGDVAANVADSPVASRDQGGEEAVSGAGAVVGGLASHRTAPLDVAAADTLSAGAVVVAANELPTPSADDEPLVVLEESSLDEFAPKDAIDLVAKLVGSAATLDPAEVAGAAVEWGMTQLLSAIFGIPMDDDASLQEILQNIKELQDGLDTLQKTVNSQELDQILNSLKLLLAEQTSYDVYNGLKDIDAKRKAGIYPDWDAAQRRKSELTGSLGIADNAWESVNNDYDRFVLQLWTAMTEPYHVTIDGKSQDLTLMQVYYEHLRMKYHWEHQAYDEWAAFQARCVGLLTTSLSLEKASLQARINLLEEWNKDPKHTKRDEGACVSRLKTIQDYINQVSGYVGKDPYGKDVNYPGLFSNKTWAAQYWMYKERPEYRYYWTSGHEILFYAAVNTQNVPQETKGKGSTSTSAKGFTYPGHHKHVVTFKFWKPFIRYHGGNTLLVSYDQLKTIYADYNAKGATASLYDIFMGDGAFTGLSGKSNNWQFVVDPDSNHALTYEEFTFKADQVYCYQVDGMRKATSLPGAGHLILCYYHYFSNEPNTNTNYIGIGVARVGAETYDPNNETTPEVCTAYISDLALWWPSADDLLLAYDHGEQGGLDRVFLDGELLDASRYTVQGGSVVLSDACLSSLSFGEHVLVLDTVGGSHTIVFDTQADGVYHTVAGEGSTWARGSNGGLVFTFKRTVDDAITFARLAGVLVDGVAAPSWAYTAQAGSAIVTLAAAFLETLAPGAHTITALFEDGNDPQATFAICAGATVRPEPDGIVNCATPAEGTPRTGDNAALPGALLAILALASGCIAFRFRASRAK